MPLLPTVCDASGPDLLDDSSHSTQHAQPLLPFVTIVRLKQPWFAPVELPAA